MVHDGERRSGVLGIGEDRELVAAPELEIDGPVRVVRALDLHGADVVERGLGLGVLHHAVDVVRLVDLSQERIGQPVADDGTLRAGVVGVLAEPVDGLLDEPRLAARAAGEIELRLRLAARLVAVGLEIVERLVLDRGGQPRPVVAQARLRLP